VQVQQGAERAERLGVTHWSARLRSLLF